MGDHGISEANMNASVVIRRYAQDPAGDSAGWTFKLLEHDCDCPDAMPQAIRATDAQGRSCVYAPIKEDGRVVDSCGFKLVKSGRLTFPVLLYSRRVPTARGCSPIAHIVHARLPKRMRPKASKPRAMPAVIVSPRKSAPAAPDDGQTRAEAADRVWRDLVRHVSGKG